jgi:hypothetical protein
MSDTNRNINLKVILQKFIKKISIKTRKTKKKKKLKCYDLTCQTYYLGH